MLMSLLLKLNVRGQSLKETQKSEEGGKIELKKKTVAEGVIEAVEAPFPEKTPFK